MSHFFGSLEGTTPAPDGTERKTRATRGGSAESGLQAILHSNEGCVKMTVYEGDDGTGGLEDRVRIQFERVSKFPGIIGIDMAGQDFELYDGPISECNYSSIRWATQESEK